MVSMVGGLFRVFKEILREIYFATVQVAGNPAIAVCHGSHQRNGFPRDRELANPVPRFRFLYDYFTCTTCDFVSVRVSGGVFKKAFHGVSFSVGFPSLRLRRIISGGLLGLLVLLFSVLSDCVHGLSIFRQSPRRSADIRWWVAGCSWYSRGIKSPPSATPLPISYFSPFVNIYFSTLRFISEWQPPISGVASVFSPTPHSVPACRLT